MIQNIAVGTPEKWHTTITTHCRKLKIMAAVLALQERFNFTSHAESPPLFYIHFFILRAERIIVGEVRGAEALDMLQAMNTGHDGSLSTGHANSTRDMLSRLETMVLQGNAGLPLPAIRQQISSALDIIIHLSRLRDKSRRTMEITEVLGCKNGEIQLNPLFVFKETQGSTLEKVQGRLVRTGNPLYNDYKLRLSGMHSGL